MVMASGYGIKYQIGICGRLANAIENLFFVTLHIFQRDHVHSISGEACQGLYSAYGFTDRIVKHGGLLVKSVFKIMGTRVISVTSWMYSPSSSRSLNSFRYFSLFVKFASVVSLALVAIFGSDRAR